MDDEGDHLYLVSLQAPQASKITNLEIVNSLSRPRRYGIRTCAVADITCGACSDDSEFL